VALDFMSNAFFFLFLILAIVVFFSLIVSIHYSIQLYKVTFSEFNNLIQQQSNFNSVHTSSILLCTLIFFVMLCNCLLLIWFTDFFFVVSGFIYINNKHCRTLF